MRLRADEDGVRRVGDLAWMKSALNDGSLGLMVVVEVVLVGKPRN